MTSWGKKGVVGEKFYKGNKDDLPTVQDLLWRKHVRHEAAQLQREPGAFEAEHNANVAVSAAASKNPPRMRMGVTGTLIPSIAPLDTSGILNTARSSRRGGSSRVPPIFGSQGGGGATARSQALVSARSEASSLTSRSSRSSRSSTSSRSGRSTSRSFRSGASAYDDLGRSPSEVSYTSSLSSRAMADLRDTIKAETQNMQRIASQEIAVLRGAMQEEAKRREEAERKIDHLTKLLAGEKLAQ
jgi:hypothetical protein